MICQGCHKRNLNENLFFNIKNPENPFKQCFFFRQRYKTAKQKRKSRENIDNYIQIDPKEISVIFLNC